MLLPSEATCPTLTSPDSTNFWLKWHLTLIRILLPELRGGLGRGLAHLVVHEVIDSVRLEPRLHSRLKTPHTRSLFAPLGQGHVIGLCVR